MSAELDVAVVGAGMAGLTAATELTRAGLDVRVYESSDHVGGRTASVRVDGYTIDAGAEQLSPHGYRATWELLARLGIPESAVPLIGGPIAMWRDGRAHAGVAEPRGLLTGAGLSPLARVDLVKFQMWLAQRRGEFDTDDPDRTCLADTTVAEFARRYHPDVHDYLLQPVAGTFFGWDTERSSAATMLSLLLAVGDASSWRTYCGGMDTLARRLAAGLDVRTGQEVQQVVSTGQGARLQIGSETVTARSVLLCVPAPVAARLHPGAPEPEGEFLRACSFTPALKVSCLLDRPLAPARGVPPYVLLTSQAEDDVLSAILFDHQKHPDRAPAGAGLLTLMPNAATTSDLLGLPDAEIIARLTDAAARYLPGFTVANRRNFVHRHAHGLPEATPAALALRSRFMARRLRPIDYAGDWVMLRPASEGAVRAGALAASRVLSRLRAPLSIPTQARSRRVETA
ncbi:NAD(P)/FAD-dependent oxidoreductase [Saccharopolyspora gloriosae]|uniref:protoporphyrinogen/coproporphyrinogen oxidase n=1 Tax=Saccharopolyspora gloriosae TaxID=455344 RepID=UPI001FB6E3CA|nr:NAD(P)/FAD-dependent oxidoreductase [Saccharopolyspora gloriosae]